MIQSSGISMRAVEDHGRNDAAPGPIAPPPTLETLSPAARSRVSHFIIGNALGSGAAPIAVIALYTDLAGDELAIRYVDQRFVLRQVPPGWREVEDRVADLESAAWSRGVDLAAAWQRAQGVAILADDPFEQLSRLAGTASNTGPSQRSIFDDPEDLDLLDPEPDESRHPLMVDRLPDILDLASPAQQKIRRFIIEERLEHGLPPSELQDLYRGFENAGDERSRQYLDRVFVHHEIPADWEDLKQQAGRVVRLAESQGRDAGRIFADVYRGSPGTDPAFALRLVTERLGLQEL